MKNMLKKILSTSLCLTILFVLASCQFFESGSTLEFEVLPDPIYYMDKTVNVDDFKNNVKVLVNGKDYSLNELEDMGATIKGIDFENAGNKILVVIFNNNTITFEYEVVDHVHTFESYWCVDNFTHWNPTTCGHTGVKGNESNHSYDNDGKCSICGWDSRAAVLVNNVGYSSLEDGLEEANKVDNSSVVLLKDCKYKTNGVGLWNITKSMIIDGNGHTISGYGLRSGNKTTLAINNGGSSKVNVTLKNITINNSGAAGRPIETRGNIGTINFDNVTINATGGGNTQCLTIGGNQATFAVVNIFNKSTFNAGSGGYPYISFNPANVTIKDSNLNGFCAMYFKGIDGSAGSKGSVVTATNCTFDCPNVHSFGSNDFGVFVMEDTRGEIDITLDSCKINADIQNTANQTVFQKYLNGGTFTIKGNSILNGIISDINNGSNASVNIESGEYILNIDTSSAGKQNNDGFKLNNNVDCNIKVKGGNFNVQPNNDYLAEGYEAVDNGDGTWTVVKNN